MVNFTQIQIKIAGHVTFTIFCDQMICGVKKVKKTIYLILNLRNTFLHTAVSLIFFEQNLGENSIYFNLKKSAEFKIN